MISERTGCHQGHEIVSPENWLDARKELLTKEKELTPHGPPSPRKVWLIGAALAVATAACWGWIVPMSLDMYGSMTGWSAWMMVRTWDITHQALLFAMWTVMMIGMMLPSATPSLLFYAATLRKSPQKRSTPTSALGFGAGYLAVWTVFSLVATVLQLGLMRGLLLSPMMEAQNRWFAGGLLLIAGAYQFTPFKRACLECCRSQVLFIAHEWKSEGVDGFRTGLVQGMNCLGCCWALMLLLFVGGVMNLSWMIGLTLFVLLEKLAPFGMQGGRLCGLLIIAMGLWTMIR